jgi:hypothetical protein
MRRFSLAIAIVLVAAAPAVTQSTLRFEVA